MNRMKLDASASGMRDDSLNMIGAIDVRELLEENVRLENTLRDLRLGIDSHSIVAFTDARGIITDVNAKFVEVSQYSREELIGAPQNIVNSGYHPRAYFTTMWRTISRGQIWQGTIRNRAKDGSHYWVATTIVPLLDVAGAIDRYLSIRTDVTQLYAAETRVRHLAYYDQLTGLPNRQYLLKQLSKTTEQHRLGASVYLTVEYAGMPMINETFGYSAGDQLLRHIGECLTSLLQTSHDDAAPASPSGDGPPTSGNEASETDSAAAALPIERMPELIARVGSSVFGIVVSGLDAAPDELDTLAQRLTTQFAELIEARIQAEFGTGIEPLLRSAYIVYSSDDGIDGAEVFTRNEIARRHSNIAGQFSESDPVTFEPSMLETVRSRAQLALDLRRGLSEGEFQLYLQPMVTADRQIRGFEGLVRWVDPVRGIVMPGEFIPLAERTGAIVEIGDWVLDQACRILAEWAHHPDTRNYTLSVNVSERQLRHDVLVDSVKSALKRHGAPPEKLLLEVTETELHRDLAQSVEILRELRAEHIHIALDDFGTGYSSLNHLNRLPVQSLKIDRSFVTSIAYDTRDAAVVDTIVRLARLMGLTVCAEGVETEEQYQVLQGFGIDSFQGYLFGKPEPRDQWGV